MRSEIVTPLHSEPVQRRSFLKIVALAGGGVLFGVGLEGEAADAVAAYLSRDREPLIVADWPEDIAQFCTLLMIGPGLIVPVTSLSFLLMTLPGFSTSANSNVPHNALHDARSLRDHVLAME